MEIVRMDQVTKIYYGKVPHRALNNIHLMIQPGEFVGIMGPSGSGKTTLLNMISTIDMPTSGEVSIKGENPHLLKKDKLALFRRKELGLVFQDYNLLETLTLGENILFPLMLNKKGLKEMEHKLEEVAKKLDITDVLDKRPYEVSGGQKQRAAIGRAMIHSPSLLLADEPTGNLDSKSSRVVMEMLSLVHRVDYSTIVLVTHGALEASYCDRVIFIKDGELYNEIRRSHSQQIFFQEIIDMLSFLGGSRHAHELSSVSME
ncbi:ABC transporter ATP-binding protein [Paenibacillus sp. AK121]|uniref:ABC transporter ATP-binding protein n=1 Tax=Paenibacillus TaxID=44249 RepID=UPI0007E99CAB|nr:MULTISPECIES: ABC transporter ATP-binding protein [Paenibacillus]MBU9708032.1 ABC transporter ATP-binding protein [Paenibacillus sp. AK121]OAZ46750.1 bacitracin ABC transporter ATP-binding protein [Paenibacillus polymyxa]